MRSSIKLLALSLLCITITTFAQLNKDKVVIKDKYFIPYISEETIKQRVQEIGQQLNTEYADKNPLFIGVLNGSVIFLADIIREMTVPCEIDTMKISSYGNAAQSSGSIKLEKHVSRSLTGRHVIIVEDIVDSGLSITFVRDLILKENPASLKIAAALIKPESAKINFPIDYVGFEVPPAFLIGYGLDYAQQGRHLKAIHILAQ